MARFKDLPGIAAVPIREGLTVGDVAKVRGDRVHRLRAMPEWQDGHATVAGAHYEPWGLQQWARAVLEQMVRDIRRPLHRPTVARYIRYVRDSRGLRRRHSDYATWAAAHRKRTQRAAHNALDAIAFADRADEGTFSLCCYLLDMRPEVVRVATLRLAAENATPPDVVLSN